MRIAQLRYLAGAPFGRPFNKLQTSFSHNSFLRCHLQRQSPQYFFGRFAHVGAGSSLKIDKTDRVIYSVNCALIREPGDEIIDGLSIHEYHEIPDKEKARHQHEEYISTLRKLGLSLTIVESDPKFPDGCFVEDVFIWIPSNHLVTLLPGAPSRRDESSSLQSVFESILSPNTRYSIITRGTIDGGDVIVGSNRLYVGLSRRTTMEAVEQLREFVQSDGFEVIPVGVPSGLHFKSGVSMVKKNLFLGLAPFLENLKEIHHARNEQMHYFAVPEEEAHAANILRINEHIVIPRNCPVTKAFIETQFSADCIHEVDLSEFAKIDGALTCCNVLFLK